MKVSVMINLDDILSTAHFSVTEAAKIITSLRASRSVNIEKKGVRDLVTRADREAESIIRSIIAERFPDHGFLGEESSGELLAVPDLSGPLWIIDPVDGTTNYAHGHPAVGISIAFAISGIVQVGVVASPFQDEVFEAVRGKGARLNGAPIRVSGAEFLSEALVATGFPYNRSDISSIMRNLAEVLPVCRDIRRIGAASLDLCWVACGRLDAFYETLLPWDLAAGALIAREAGAVVGHFGPPPTSGWPDELRGERLLVANKGVYQELSRILK